jgi:hypothetical protein
MRPFLALFILAGLGALVIWGFLEGRKEAAVEAGRERPIKEPLRVSMRDGAPVITLDPETRQRSGIETAPPAAASHQEQLRAYGMVLDLARLTDLNNNYANAKAQLQTMQAKLAASSPAFDRAQSLYKIGQTVALAQLQTAEAAFRVDQAAVTAADSQVRTLAATAAQEWGPVLGKSLIDGSPMVAGLIERREFLLQITLPPGVSVPKPPATATVQTGKDARSTITFVSPATRTDPRIQGISFFYMVPAETGLLPGMNVLAFLPSGITVEGFIIPPQAIIWWQDRAWVYHQTYSEAFTRVEISTELPAPGGGYVVKNFPSDAEIVMRGAQLLLSEEFRAQIQVGEDKK